MLDPRATVRTAGWTLVVLLAGCVGGTPHPTDTAGSPPVSGPYVRVLGTAQDGGFPHAACRCDRCTAARKDPSRARKVASLAVVVPGSDQVWLIDATPDIRGQLDVIHDLRGNSLARVDRSPVTGVLLTHAHLGHYTGLAFFGYESIHTRELPVLCSSPMAAYLRDNGPWSQLVDLNNVSLRELRYGEPVELGDGVSVTAFKVPHRDEFADTVAFVLSGPRSSVLYIPDCDPWKRWDEPPEALLEGIDVALLDGTFYSGDELPGRDLDKIGHPLVTDSMDRFQELVDSGRMRVYFTHFNHSNPALDAEGPAREAIERRGFGVLADGDEIPL